ncbi:hypothetical protein [Solitalea lacus]|uniref:hypothetical protein n=1 Tax=Solitalea lacus TaxID=2911172 RepID=UPI001EDC26A3|nr:hypothetical protein [Solitalea lacus]UKJ06316.1 hypothetical protein L2B55_12295 [Solitalea lacus]
MTQEVKLTFILQYLYSKKFDGGYHSIIEILQEKGIEVNINESNALARELEHKGFIKASITKDGASAFITSEGVDYIENMQS